MKILEVVFHLNSGGAERFVVDLSNELSKTNEVVLLALKEDKSNPEEFLFYKFDLSERVKYKNVGLPSSSYKPFTMWQVYKAIKAEKPDIVHMHAAGMPKFCYLANLLLGKKITFVQTIHNDVNRGYSTAIYDFLHATLGRWKMIRFAAISETNYQEQKKLYPHTMATCIVNGRAPMQPTEKIEDVRREIASLKKKTDTIVVLHVARCNPQKNQMLLIDSFNTLIAKGTDAMLLIIGNSYDSELGASLKVAAGPNIYFLGTRKNISDYMANADVFVLSSAFEGMPITIIEALLSGVPVVSTPVCGAVDAVDGKNGVLSDGYTTDSYTAALSKVISNLAYYKANAQKMKENSPYTIKACAEKYLEFFKSQETGESYPLLQKNHK